jgi:hypothetical protein
MGYKGDVLRAQFCPDKISKRMALAPVTVANTQECQEASAIANTHGKKFFVMGGANIPEDVCHREGVMQLKLAEIDEVGANDGQSPQPTPTPI